MIRWKPTSGRPRPEFSKLKKRRLKEFASKPDLEPAKNVDRNLPRCRWVNGIRLGNLENVAEKIILEKNSYFDRVAAASILLHDDEWGPDSVVDDNRYLLECLTLHVGSLAHDNLE
jgi:hypothetical protein